MTIEDLNELSKGEGIILAYKEGNSIYPIFLNRQDANALNLFIGGMKKEIQVLRAKENEYRKVEEQLKNK